MGIITNVGSVQNLWTQTRPLITGGYKKAKPDGNCPQWFDFDYVVDPPEDYEFKVVGKTRIAVIQILISDYQNPNPEAGTPDIHVNGKNIYGSGGSNRNVGNRSSINHRFTEGVEATIKISTLAELRPKHALTMITWMPTGETGGRLGTTYGAGRDGLLSTAVAEKDVRFRGVRAVLNHQNYPFFPTMYENGATTKDYADQVFLEHNEETGFVLAAYEKDYPAGVNEMSFGVTTGANVPNSSTLFCEYAAYPENLRW